MGRNDLDLNFVIQALLNKETYEQIAKRESIRLGWAISRNLIAGVARDLKDGKIRPSTQTNSDWIRTYVWGKEPDNGGIPLFIGQEEIFEDRFVVISDLHCPYTNTKFLEDVIPISQHYGIKYVVLAGDILENETQANYRKKVKGQGTDVGIRFIRELLDYLFNYFEGGVILPGNHDDWFLQNNEGELTIHDFVGMFSSEIVRRKLLVTPYDNLTMVSQSEQWFVPHQAEASGTSLVVGSKLVAKYRKNVIVPHQHTTAIGTDPYGLNIIMDIGGFSDEKKSAWKGTKTTTRGNFRNGFGIVVDGQGKVIFEDTRILRT